MALGITPAALYGSQTSNNISKTGKTSTGKCGTGSTPQKPVWDPNKPYQYLEDMSQGFQNYGKQAVSYYSALIEGQGGDGTLTEEELKAEIKELFPEYTLTNSEPRDVVAGKFYLYIDAANLKKMAADPSYRAKVYGLMDREIQGKKGYTLTYSDGRNVKTHLTGSIFSLADSNKKYAGADGIPYRGSCMSDQPFSSSESHAQVRSMSFLHDNLDPAKSAARDRKINAEKMEAERLEKKRKKKKEEEERLEEERLEEKQLEKEKEERLLAAEQLKAGSYYKSAEDIKTETEEEIPEKEEKEEEERKATVTFNAGKRAAQIAACMTSADIKAVMGLLSKDLSDCEMGASEGMCDEAEIEKVRAMIQNAQKKSQQLAAQNKGKEEGQDDRLTINLLM